MLRNAKGTRLDLPRLGKKSHKWEVTRDGAVLTLNIVDEKARAEDRVLFSARVLRSNKIPVSNSILYTAHFLVGHYRWKFQNPLDQFVGVYE